MCYLLAKLLSWLKTVTTPYRENNKAWLSSVIKTEEGNHNASKVEHNSLEREL